MKKFGNRLLEVLGWPSHHPVNLAVGGFYRLPKREELTALILDLNGRSTRLSMRSSGWLDFPFPDFQVKYDYVALSHPDEYRSWRGKSLVQMESRSESKTTSNVLSRSRSHSTALQSHRLPGHRPYFVGPLARMNLNRQQLSPAAQRVADEIGWQTPCNNPYQGNRCPGIRSVVHAFRREFGHSAILSTDWRGKGAIRSSRRSRLFDYRSSAGTHYTIDIK